MDYSGGLRPQSRRQTSERSPGILTPYIDYYVEVVRPALQPHCAALWIGMYGEAMSYSAVESAITKTTETNSESP